MSRTAADAPRFRPYRDADREECLALFDANSPEYFARNERVDYETYLAETPTSYEVCEVGARVVGAFGLKREGFHRVRVNWILLDPTRHGHGLGGEMMRRVLAWATDQKVAVVDIAASHRSAPFFARFGATELQTTRDGWGAGMHRVDMELRIATD